jgi:hypothetical protein
MKIKNFTRFNESLKDDLTSKLDNKYKDIKEEVISLIEKSLSSSDKKVFDDFTTSFIKDPKDNQIEGLINDSDIYEFYLKYRNDIDEVLSDVKYYDVIPSSLNVFGLYDYIVSGTLRAVLELITLIKEDIK